MALESPVQTRQPQIHIHHQQQTQPQQQHQRPNSLIDNTLAQVCNRKRRISSLSTPSLLNSSSSSSTPLFKMSKSDSTITGKLRMQSNTTAALHLSLPASPKPQSAPNQFTHRHSTGSNVVMIVQDGCPFMESSSSTSTSTSTSTNETIDSQHHHPYQDMSPDTLIKSILCNHHRQQQAEQVVVDQEVDEAVVGMVHEQQPITSHPPTIPKSLPQVYQPLHETDFLHPTEEQIAAYNTHIITAVRASDIYALRTMHNNGQTLGCCNRYGESILHMACRRSDAYVVSFLLKEANVSPRIKDDHGRTPLHDACWRGRPEYSIVKLLLSVEPRLAFAKDVWGHTPFQYARKEHWGAWNEFLESNRDLILS